MYKLRHYLYDKWKDTWNKTLSNKNEKKMQTNQTEMVFLFNLNSWKTQTNCKILKLNKQKKQTSRTILFYSSLSEWAANPDKFPYFLKLNVQSLYCNYTKLKLLEEKTANESCNIYLTTTEEFICIKE